LKAPHAFLARSLQHLNLEVNRELFFNRVAASRPKALAMASG
jgi:hypothetical protein